MQEMDVRKWVLPAVALVGGAMLGRLVGLKGLVRVGMTALTVATMSESAGLLTAPDGTGHEAPVRRARRSARKRSAHKSARKKVASGSRRTQAR